jgi:adenylate cyclase
MGLVRFIFRQQTFTNINIRIQSLSNRIIFYHHRIFASSIFDNHNFELFEKSAAN